MNVAIANQKGGVGKTTTAVNLAYALAEEGARTLLIDADPQCNATSVLIPDNYQGETLYDVLLKGVPLEKAVCPSNHSNLFLVPSSPDLAAAEIELADVSQRETGLRNHLRRVASHFDYVLIDCPPSLGLLTINVLTAVDQVLIPIQCEYYALEGVNRLLDTLARVQKALNPALHVGGILLTMRDNRTILSSQVSANVREIFGDQVYEQAVPRNVPLSEAPSFRQTVFEFDPKCKGALAYRKVAEEFRTRMKASVV